MEELHALCIVDHLEFLVGMGEGFRNYTYKYSDFQRSDFTDAASVPESSGLGLKEVVLCGLWPCVEALETTKSFMWLCENA